MKIVWIFFFSGGGGGGRWGASHNWTNFRGHLYIFYFYLSKFAECGYFLGLQKIQIFVWGA